MAKNKPTKKQMDLFELYVENFGFEERNPSSAATGLQYNVMDHIKIIRQGEKHGFTDARLAVMMRVPIS